jgi:CRAL/TRIO domain
MSQEIFEIYEKELKAFQEWIQSNPRLPQKIGEIENSSSLWKRK